MKKAIIPIVFALAGTSFVTYSYLDTFVLEKEYNVSFDAGGESQFAFSFAEINDDLSSEPPAPSSSKDSSIDSEKKSDESKLDSSEQTSSAPNSSEENSSAPSSSETTSSQPSSSEEEIIDSGIYYEDLTRSQIVKSSSASNASLTSTRNIVRVIGSIVVSQSCSGFISPRPL